MGVMRDRMRRSLGGSAVMRGGTVMIGGIKIINQSVNNLTIGGSSDTITISGAASLSSTLGVTGALTASAGIITQATGGTSPAGGVLGTNGGIIVGFLGGTARIFARVGGTTFQFNGTGL